MYAKYLNTRHPNEINICKTYRDQLTEKLSHSRNQYYNDRNRSDITWKMLNGVLKRNSRKKVIENNTLYDIHLTCPHLAKAFNNFFVNLVREKHQSGATDYIIFRNGRYIILDPVQDSKLVSIFLQLNNSSSCDANRVQDKTVNHIIDLISSPLANIFILCLSNGEFTSRMQLAEVSVLYKEGGMTELGK